MHRRMPIWFGLALLVGACAETGPGDDQTCESKYDGDCAATKESGLLLKALGRYDYRIPVGAEQELTALVARLAQGDCTGGGVAAGVPVTFSIITPNAQASLSEETVPTGPDGMARVAFTAQEAGTYQIQAKADGTCPVTFTVQVARPNRGLKPVGPETVYAWTHSRANLSVQAYAAISGQGEYPLAGEEIRFRLGDEGEGAALVDLGGQTNGTEVTVVTGANGVATVAVNTGSVPVPAGITVRAELEGTQSVVFHVIVREYSSEPCETNADCPLDYPVCDNGVCIETSGGSGSCETDADCVAPYRCLPSGNGKSCQMPSNQGQRCDGITTNNPCPEGQVCVGGFCVDDPDNVNCQTNDDCPIGFICQDGACIPDPNNGNYQCVTPEDCPAGKACVGGFCVDPDTDCTPAPDPTRLQGTWSFDSILHLRQALAGWVSGFLSAMEFFRDIILGNADLGLPGWLEDLVEDAIRSLIETYVPPWGQQLIVVLGDLSDILDDMHLLHTVHLVAAGNYEYSGTTTWDLVEFEYRGQMVSTRPEDIPEIGQVPTYTFTSREICHVYFIDRHEVRNVVGGIIRWLIDALVTMVTCSQGWGCYYSLEEALDALIDCDAIATAIDDFVYDTFGVEAYDAALSACEAGKDPAIDAIIRYLEQLTVTFSVLSMRGQAPILDDRHLGSAANPGRWYGSLAGGNWQGEFTAVKQ